MMGYFPNGTSAEIYADAYCEQCRNWQWDESTDTFGCPIYDLHIIHNYDPKMREVLDHFIPRKGVENLECKMFLPKGYRCTKTPDMLKETGA